MTTPPAACTRCPTPGPAYARNNCDGSTMWPLWCNCACHEWPQTVKESTQRHTPPAAPGQADAGEGHA